METTGGSLTLLRQPVSLAELMSFGHRKRDPVSKNIKVESNKGKIPDVKVQPPHVCTHVCMCTCTTTHTHTSTHSHTQSQKHTQTSKLQGTTQTRCMIVDGGEHRPCCTSKFWWAVRQQQPQQSIGALLYLYFSSRHNCSMKWP